MTGQEHRVIRVLAVDDDPRIRLLIADVLDGPRCQVLTAANGAEAVQILLREPVDLLITDYDMPLMDGLELIRWSKARLPHVTAVIITGRNPEGLAAAGRGCGAARILSKPFGIEQLLALVNHVRAGNPPSASL
jgi:CheY-like chemotaxis protein